MNPELQLKIRRAVRRRLAQHTRWGGGMSDLSELGSVSSDLTRRTNLLNSIQTFQSELLHAVSGLSRGNAVFDNATAYADTMTKMLQMLGDQQVEIGIRAGGNAGNEAIKMMNSYDKLLASRKAMWNADLYDPSGAASMQLANQERIVAQAKTVQAAENVAFWEKVTNVDNPFSPVGILSTIKKYAIWFLVIGGVVLAAPVLFPAVGKLIGHARRPESSPSRVAANRRRRC